MLGTVCRIKRVSDNKASSKGSCLVPAFPVAMRYLFLDHFLFFRRNSLSERRFKYSILYTQVQNRLLLFVTN